MIETNEYREILKTELQVFDNTEYIATFNKHFNIKTAVIAVKFPQIICGNFVSFRATKYKEEWAFHPEITIADMYDADVEGLVLYIAKLNIKNEAQPSRPCRECMIHIKRCEEVNAIVYRDDKLRIIKEVLE